MKICMVYPALLSPWSSYVEHGNNESSYMDHGFAMISAVLKRADHETFMVDLRSLKSWEHFRQIITDSQFDMSLISFLSCQEKYAREAVAIMKQIHPNKIIVAGGIHLSVTKTESYPNVDTVVWGEGEAHIVDIVSKVAKGEKPDALYQLKQIENLDDLPFVDRHLFNPRMEETSPLLPMLPEPFVTIVAGRGCWGQCTFCAPSRELISGKKCRIRSVKNFLDEIEILDKGDYRDRGGIGSLMIHDDLLGTKPWMALFISEWKRRIGRRIPMWCQLRADTVIRMREFVPELSEIGLTWVSLGLESGSPRMLEFLKKGCTVEQNIEACNILHENNVNIFGNYIVGLPTETDEDLAGTEKMIAAVKPEWHSASVYTSYPSSYLYEWIKANDYWVPGDEHYGQRGYHSRYPYERKIKNVDYAKLGAMGERWRANYTSPLRRYQNRGFTTPNNSSAVIPNKESLEPEVSIIIVTYNRPEYLREAINSIKDQSIQNWELIIIDYTVDWSINQSIYDSVLYDKRIRYIRHNKNIDNISYCWNEGIDLAKGKFIATLDDDNRKKSTFCEQMTKALNEHPECDVAVCGNEHFGEVKGNSQGGIHMQRNGDYSLNTLRAGNLIDSGEMMYRRELFDKIGYFDERLTACDDWDMVLRIWNMSEGKAFFYTGKVLNDYRWHNTKRMYRSNELGITACNKIILEKRMNNELKVRIHTTSGAHGRTASQIQLAEGIIEAITSIPFVKIDNQPDINVIIGPLWNFTKAEIDSIKDKTKAPVMALLCEDPQGMTGNLFLANEIDWLVTNDANSYRKYLIMMPKPAQVYFWNCLSISNRVMEYCKTHDPYKDIDVCLVGYPYPSRVTMIKRLRELLDKSIKITVIGDTWDTHKIPDVTCYPTLDEVKAAEIAIHSKIVICKHRIDGDCGGFPVVVPANVNRGYIECAYRTVVMIDTDRKEHSFDNEEVLFYNDADDAAGQIQIILKNYDLYNQMRARAYASAERNFTHKARLTKILNAFRSIRYNMKVR